MRFAKKLTIVVLPLVLAIGVCPALAIADNVEAERGVGGGIGAKNTGRESKISEASVADASTEYRKTHREAEPLVFPDVVLSIGKYAMPDNTVRYLIVINKGSVSRVFASNTGDGILSNGRYLFYSKRCGKATYSAGGSSWDCRKYVLYRFDLETGRQERLIALACDNLVPYACDGDFVYCGGSKSLFGADLYAVDLTTHEVQFMASGVGSVSIVDERVVVGMNHSVGGNHPVYSFAKGGTDKRQIAKAMEVKVLDGRVHYIVFAECGRYKEFSCSPIGEDKEAVTGWTSEIDWRDWRF